MVDNYNRDYVAVIMMIVINISD